MLFNRQKIFDIIFHECQSIEERYDGYKEELAGAIDKILEHEKEHLLKMTPIHQKIREICQKTGDSLAESRNQLK